MLKIVLLLIAGSAFLYYGVPLVYTLYRRRKLVRQAGQSRQLVLTFDDGPGDRLTPRLLDILREDGSKAMFFLLGRNIAGREELARRIASEGHVLGAHGFAHIHYWKAGPVRTIQDIRHGWSALDEALGRRGGVYPFRPPYGKLNLAALLYLWMHRAPIVYWTFDLGDTWAPAQGGPRPVETLTVPSGGAVVLAHDFDRTQGAIDNTIVLSVRTLLAQARQAQMPVVPLAR